MLDEQTCTVTHFHNQLLISSRDSNSGPHAWGASTSPGVPSLRSSSVYDDSQPGLNNLVWFLSTLTQDQTCTRSFWSSQELLWSLLLLLCECVCQSCCSQPGRHGLCQCIFNDQNQDCKYPEESLSVSSTALSIPHLASIASPLLLFCGNYTFYISSFTETPRPYPFLYCKH